MEPPANRRAIHNVGIPHAHCVWKCNISSKEQNNICALCEMAENHDPLRLVALEATKGLYLELLKKGQHIADNPGTPHAVFLSISSHSKHLGDGSSRLKHFADVVEQIEGDIPKVDARAVLGKPIREYTKLPDPFGLKDDGALLTMSLYVRVTTAMEGL